MIERPNCITIIQRPDFFAETGSGEAMQRIPAGATTA
jgi:hypothetical protein